MAYEQAFHTCCREGLTTPTLAFQFQACSPGVDAVGWSTIARQMVGYKPPTSSPPAPTESEIRDFPIALRYFNFPDLGRAISQTIYVGREDRKANSGRYGNYFSHVVLARDGENLGLAAPVLAWGSADWRTDANPADGVALSSFAPGPASIAVAQSSLEDSNRRAWLAALHDWLPDVLENRTRLVVLDEPALGWAWIAAVSIPLPAGLSSLLSFETYCGDPNHSTAQICVTAPGTDSIGLARSELTGSVHVIDPTQQAPEPSGLLARAVAAGRRHSCGPGIDDDLSLDEYAVLLACDGPEPMPLQEADLRVVIATVASWLNAGEPHAGDTERAIESVNRTLDLSVDASALDPAAATVLIEIAAKRPQEIPATATNLAVRLALLLPQTAAGLALTPIAGTTPSPEVIGEAINLLTQSELDPPLERRNLFLVERLGLVGVNNGVDRRVGRIAAHCIAEPDVADCLQGLARRSGGNLAVEHAVRALAAGAELNQPALEFLADPVVDALTRVLAAEADAFPIAYARAAALGYAHPDRNRETLAWAVPLAESPAAVGSLIDVIYGTQLTTPDMRDVIAVLGRTGQRPGGAVLERGWKLLEDGDPFSGDPAVAALADDLNTLDNTGRRRSTYITIQLERERLSVSPADWVASVATSHQWLSPRHLQGLISRCVQEITDGTMSADDHMALVEAGIRALGEQFVDCYWEDVSRALRDTRRTDLGATVVVAWLSEATPQTVYEEVYEVRLVKALGVWSQDARDELGLRLGRYGPEWLRWWIDGWCVEHPAGGAVGRSMRRAVTWRPRG